MPGRGLPIAPFPGQLVDIVDRAEADHRRVDHVVDKRLGVLRRLALIAVDAFRAQVLIAERIARVLAITLDQPRHHLDQRGFPGPRFAIAHEGKDEPAEFRERVQAAVEIIGHQHLGELHRLIFGDMIADDLMRLLEGHGQRRGFALGRGVKAADRQVIGLDAPTGLREGFKPRGVLGAQGDLFHQLLGETGDRGHKAGIVAGVRGDVLIHLPKRAVQGQLCVVGQNLFDLAHLDGHLTAMRPEQERRGVGKDMRHGQRFGGH